MLRLSAAFLNNNSNINCSNIKCSSYLYITSNISNPGNTSSVSLWNQLGVGPTISGYQFVVQTNGTTERLRIDNTGLLTTSSNIDCGGGIALTGSTAFAWEADSVDAGNKTNTYINFRNAGASSDWCYLRQIGGTNAFKLALDFYDDGNDARFCIRNVQSTNNTDTITEVFTVDNGNVSFTGELKSSYWKLTNQSDYCRLYTLDGTSYFKFAASDLWAQYTLSVGTTASIGGNLNCGSLSVGGNLNCGSLSVGGNSIYNNLFNSSGFDHGTITDLNSITNFGYRFINYPGTNGPGTSYITGQYYTWMIGLGIGYNYDSHGAQFCIPRNVTNPILSIRYREGGTWGGWQNITAGGLTNGDQTINGNLTIAGYLIGGFQSANKSPSDYLGLNFDTTQGYSYYGRTVYVLFGTFTGFHRCFIEDELFNKDEAQKFKEDYVGRIVIATGKIATDLTNDNNEWEILYDKEGITIEDAVPIIQLSRKKKDKRVFGVIGDPRRNNSRPERLIVNSVGEGGIWVCNSNGNIENGDYITSSDYLGYGEKQDDDLLHNYSVAKATMDCNFELESNLYNCIEIENNIRIAFIACSYHCG